MNKRYKISKFCSRKGYGVRNKWDSLAYEVYDRLQEAKRENIPHHYRSKLRQIWTIYMSAALSCSSENFNDYFETKFAVLPTS